MGAGGAIDALETIAAALYALPPSGFVAERTARARAAREDGDRDLAARIGALPKPSAAAWLADLLAGHDDELLQRVVDLGAALQEAQEHGDRDRLRSLTGERRDLLDEAATRARALAEAAGGPAGDAALDGLQQTLLAAMADDGAAAAVRSGRLVRGLTADGIEAVDLAGALAGGPASAPPRRAHAPRRREPDDDRERREQEAAAARERARAARAEADEAASRARDAAALAEERGEAVEALRARVAELETELRTAEAAHDAARSAAAGAAEAADEAAERADRAAAGAVGPGRG